MQSLEKHIRILSEFCLWELMWMISSALTEKWMLSRTQSNSAEERKFYFLPSQACSHNWEQLTTGNKLQLRIETSFSAFGLLRVASCPSTKFMKTRGGYWGEAHPSPGHSKVVTCCRRFLVIVCCWLSRCPFQVLWKSSVLFKLQMCLGMYKTLVTSSNLL